MPPPPMPEDKRLAILQMVADGDHTYREIGMAVGYSESRVEQIVRAHRKTDPGEPWDWRAQTPEDARLVLDVLAYLIARSNGANTSMTRSEAGGVLRIRQIAPHFTPAKAWELAQVYRIRETTGQDTADLDCLMAFAPIWPDGPADQCLRHMEIHGARWPGRAFRAPIGAATLSVLDSLPDRTSAALREASRRLGDAVADALAPAFLIPSAQVKQVKAATKAEGGESDGQT